MARQALGFFLLAAGLAIVVPEITHMSLECFAPPMSTTSTFDSIQIASGTLFMLYGVLMVAASGRLARVDAAVGIWCMWATATVYLGTSAWQFGHAVAGLSMKYSDGMHLKEITLKLHAASLQGVLCGLVVLFIRFSTPTSDTAGTYDHATNTIGRPTLLLLAVAQFWLCCVMMCPSFVQAAVLMSGTTLSTAVNSSLEYNRLVTGVMFGLCSLIVICAAFSSRPVGWTDILILTHIATGVVVGVRLVFAMWKFGEVCHLYLQHLTIWPLRVSTQNLIANADEMVICVISIVIAILIRSAAITLYPRSTTPRQEFVEGVRKLELDLPHTLVTGSADSQMLPPSAAEAGGQTPTLSASAAGEYRPTANGAPTKQVGMESEAIMHM